MPQLAARLSYCRATSPQGPAWQLMFNSSTVDACLDHAKAYERYRTAQLTRMAGCR